MGGERHHSCRSDSGQNHHQEGANGDGGLGHQGQSAHAPSEGAGKSADSMAQKISSIGVTLPTIVKKPGKTSPKSTGHSHGARPGGHHPSIKNLGEKARGEIVGEQVTHNGVGFLLVERGNAVGLKSPREGGRCVIPPFHWFGRRMGRGTGMGIGIGIGFQIGRAHV